MKQRTGKQESRQQHRTANSSVLMGWMDNNKHLPCVHVDSLTMSILLLFHRRQISKNCFIMPWRLTKMMAASTAWKMNPSVSSLGARGVTLQGETDLVWLLNMCLKDLSTLFFFFTFIYLFIYNNKKKKKKTFIFRVTSKTLSWRTSVWLII